jgi:hypothetical protein
MEAVFVADAAIQRRLHRGDVIGGEFDGFQVGEAPPDFAQSRLNVERAAIGGDPVCLPPHGFQHMAIRHPDFGLFGDLLQNLFVQRNCFVEPTDTAQSGGLQIGAADVFGIVSEDKVEFGNCFGGFVLAIEAGGEIGARRAEIGGELKRAAQEIFGVLIPSDASREFGHHADGGNVKGVFLQMRTEQRFGIGQAVIVERQRGLHQARIVDATLYRPGKGLRGRQGPHHPLRACPSCRQDRGCGDRLQGRSEQHARYGQRRRRCSG